MNLLKNNTLKFLAILYMLWMIFIFVADFFTAFFSHRIFINLILFFSTLLLMILLFLFREKIKKIKKSVFYFLITFGVFLHFFLLFISYSDVTGDYATLYGGAESFANNTFAGNCYIALFPHLWGYIAFLGSIFKIFGTGYHVIVLTNIILNFISTFFCLPNWKTIME